MYSNRVQYIIKNLYNKNKDKLLQNKKMYSNLQSKNKHNLVIKRNLSGYTNKLPPKNNGNPTLLIILAAAFVGIQNIFYKNS